MHYIPLLFVFSGHHVIIWTSPCQAEEEAVVHRGELSEGIGVGAHI